MSHAEENVSIPSSENAQPRAAGSPGNHWVQMAPTFDDWLEQIQDSSPGYRIEVELDDNAGGVAIQFARNGNATSDYGETSGGWLANRTLEEGCVLRAHFDTTYLTLNPEGTDLKAEGYFSIAKPFTPTRYKTAPLAQVGDVMTLTIFVPEDGDYRVRVGTRFENSDVTTERPKGASRVSITLEKSIVMQAPGDPVAV